MRNVVTNKRRLEAITQKSGDTTVIWYYKGGPDEERLIKMKRITLDEVLIVRYKGERGNEKPYEWRARR